VFSACVINLESAVPGCAITVPVASGAKNSELSPNALTNVGNNVEIKSVLAGITAKIPAACAAAGLETGEKTKGELKGTSTLLGIKAV
jgi:hypothetical protein